MSHRDNRLYEFGLFRLDAAERLLLRDGESVPLTPKSFDLLLVLVERHGHLLEKDELLKKVWPDTFIEEANLSYNISLIRKALGDGENGQKFIETVPKRGYRFVANVAEVAGQELSPDCLAKPAASVATETTRVSPRRRRVVFALAALIIAGVAMGLYQLLSRRHARPKVSVSTLQITPLTSFLEAEYFPSLSPDGKQLVFVWRGKICVRQIDGQGFLQLTTSPANNASPVWSPDGYNIAFLRFTPEDKGIYLMPAIGGPERKLVSVFPGQEFRRRLAWSPDGKLLALADRNSAQEPLSLYLVSVETGEKRRLTYPSHALVYHHSPAFSPDGKTLAFVQWTRRSEGPVNLLSLEDTIYLVHVAGGEPARLRLETAGGALPRRAIDPVWTPDGKELIFSSFQAEHLPAKLWRVPALGGVIEEIPVGVIAEQPAISARGDRLVFVKVEFGLDIWRNDLGSPAPARQPAHKFISSTLLDANQEFSPDGKKIVFSSNRSGKWELWICDSDSANLRQLTTDVNEPGSPRWSPDGKAVVFDAHLGEGYDVCVISAEGGKWTRLTTGPPSSNDPCWSQDGNWIYFGSNRNGQEQIWKLPATGGEAVQVTQQGGYAPIASKDGRFIYYGKKRLQPGIWRIPVAGGAETLVLDQHGAGLGKQWTLTEDGIYFVAVEDPAHPSVEFFSFATGKVSRVVALTGPVVRAFRGLAVSPDKRWLLSTQLDQSGSDIMLLENFR